LNPEPIILAVLWEKTMNKGIGHLGIDIKEIEKSLNAISKIMNFEDLTHRPPLICHKGVP
jgi:hypothetical protein